MSIEPARPLDRRQRKTRSALDGALLRLIAQQPYAGITVEDIVNTADVARATFYAHYRDKDDLLAAANERLMTDLMTTVADVSWQDPPKYSAIGAQTILRHVDEHRDLYRLLISGEGGTAARDVLVTRFIETATKVFTAPGKKRGKKPRLPMPIITSAYVGALLLTIEKWLEGVIDQDADTLAVSFMQAQAGGLEWSLGYQPGDIVYAPGQG
jgi:AcrR family transcriptional regulator